eukprot:Opistho-2@6792
MHSLNEVFEVEASLARFADLRVRRRLTHALVIHAILISVLFYDAASIARESKTVTSVPVMRFVFVLAVVAAHVALLRTDDSITRSGVTAVIRPLLRTGKKSQVIAKAVTSSYDATASPSVHSFTAVAEESSCLFAKSAKMWGSPGYNSAISLEDNIRSSVPMLTLCAMEALNSRIDAFVIEINGDAHFSSLKAFASTVNRTLRTLSDADPRGAKCMSRTYIDKPGWHFEFAGMPFFVTTFAPCYPQDGHARYCAGGSVLGTGERSCFVLFQPEVSFHQKSLPLDDPTTEEDNPRHIRDRIRNNFKREGMEYDVPPTVVYSPAIHIVRPMDALSTDVVRWWEEK